jgi:hypothetical protein
VSHAPVFGFLVQAVLIYFIGKGYGAARDVLLIALALGSLGFAFSPYRSMLSSFTVDVEVGLRIVGMVLLFTSPARQWFSVASNNRSRGP